jgi:RNA-binding protein
MVELTSRQRALLRSIAQATKPILQIGKDGVTDRVVDSVDAALNNRELLKVRVLDTAPASARELGDELAGRMDGVHLVQVIGRTLVLYRRHPEKPEINLPV